jgi:aspartate racemase
MLNADPGLKYFSLLFYHLRLRGIHIWEGRGNFLSTAHTDEHCAAILRAFLDSVHALQQGGFFPGGTRAAGPAEAPGAAAPATLASTPAPAPAPAPIQASIQRTPAPASLAPTIAYQTAVAAPSPASPLNLPLTPEQQELFLSARLSPESSVAAHESVTLKLNGPLDRSRLASALHALAARHGALRASFAPDGSHQRVAAEVVVPLRDIPASRLEEEAAAQFLEPFNLAEAPLWRAALASHAPHEHSLVITAHHLICDGWSFGVIAHELPRLYLGQPLPPATPLHEVVTGERDEEAPLYWRHQFTTPPTAVELPADRPRPAVPDLAARTLRGSFSKALATRLREFCRREKATPNAVLLSAWQVLLHRLSGNRDIIVGTPIAGQLASGRTSIVAHQVHFLPLRVAIEQDLTVTTLVGRTRGQLADATDHQDFTLGQLYQALTLPRVPGRPSFVTTTFTCETAPGIEDWGDGLQARLEPNPKRRLAFDASLFVITDGESLRWQLVYQQALFAEATVAHWMRCLETLLGSMMERPDAPVDRLDLLAPEDARLILETWNHAGQPELPARAIHELFEEQAARSPEAPALLWGGGGWTYGQLDERANQFAHELLAAGLRPAQKVALVTERSPQMVAALLGILKAGGSYAPIDTNYPNERLSVMLRDLASTLIACDPNQRERVQRLLGTIPAAFVDVTASPPENWRAQRSSPGVSVPPSAPAYIIFTSGSTGQPKGTVVPHRAVVRLVHGQDFATMTAAQTWLQLAPLSFDASTLELFAPLLHGGRLALMPPGTASLPGIGAALRDHRVTSLWLTAGLFQLMVDERLDALAPLQELLTGGDVVSVPHAKRVLERFPSLRLINGYGPTENTTFTCCHTIGTGDLDRPALPIGRPIAHTTVFIVDENGEPCPLGVAGELLTGGLGLAQGYWRREELTAEKFIDHPRFGRVYRTGDRARWRLSGESPDGPLGVIEFLGRADTQIKVRGFRIEPGEIEAALVAHSGVRQAAVRARGASSGDRRLVAWCVPAGAFLPPTSDLRAHLRRLLPDYMVPQDYVPVLGALPLTPNGKLDEKALPSPDAGEPAAGATSSPSPGIAPRTDTERRLHRLMSEAIGRGGFGVRDDFFELGGDSLRGLSFFNMIEKDFGQALPLGTLFAAPTIEKLALVLGGGTDALPSHLIPIQPRGSEPPLFLIHGGDGGVMFYRKAVARLGADQPVYGIEAPMLTDATLLSPGASVTAIAEDYLALVRQVQPLGPYRLGGYSFGGVVAYEMGRLLRESGETVEHLFLFDTDNPAVAPHYFTSLGRIAARWRMDRADGLSLPQCVSSLAGRFLSGLSQKYRLRQELAAVKAARTTGRRDDDMVRPFEVREATMGLMATYVPSPTTDGLTLFRCRGLNDKFEHTPALGWETVVADDLEVIPITGTHLQLFDEPHVSLLAERLAACLRRRPVTIKHEVLELVPA